MDNVDQSSPIEEADKAAGVAIASRKDHPVMGALGELSEFGDQGPLYLVGGTIVAAGWLRRDPRFLFTGAAVLVAVGTADLLKNAVKGMVKRSRPDHAMETGEYRFEGEGSPRKEEQSFPSGHTACTVAAVEAAGRYYPGLIWYLRPVAAVLALGRVAKGKHWPLDLLAGAGIGLVADTVARVLVPCRKRDR